MKSRLASLFFLLATFAAAPSAIFCASLTAPRGPRTLSGEVGFALSQLPASVQLRATHVLTSSPEDINVRCRELDTALVSLSAKFSLNPPNEAFPLPATFVQMTDEPRSEEDAARAALRIAAVEKVLANHGQGVIPSAVVDRAFAEVSPDRFDEVRADMLRIAYALGRPRETDATAVEMPADFMPRIPDRLRPSPQAKRASMAAAFERMPKSWRRQFNRSYAKSLAKIKKRGYGSIYQRRREAGDEHSLSLLGLGWTEGKDERGDAILVPPADWREFFLGYSQVSRAVEPGLIFVPKKKRLSLAPRRSTAPRDYIFIRPGTDPWPDENKYEPSFERAPLYLPLHGALTQASEDLLPYAAWFGALARGIVPFAFDSAELPIDHSLAHLTEYYASADVALQTRRYAQLWTPKLFESLEGGKTAPAHIRDTIALELFAYPNVKNAQLIRQLIPQWFSLDGPRGYNGALDYLGRMPQDRRLDHVKELLLQADRLLVRYGASTRDPDTHGALYSRDRIMQTVSWTIRIAPNEPWPPDELPANLTRGDNLLNEVSRETLIGLVDEMEVVYQMIRQPESFPRRYGYDQLDALDKIDPVLKVRLLNDLLIDLTAKFELALATALNLSQSDQLTAEKIRGALLLGVPGDNSAVGKYFKTVYHRHSAHYQAMEFTPTPE